jgi:hypothetical protein
MKQTLLITILSLSLLTGCGDGQKGKTDKQTDPIAMKVEEFTSFKLTSDLSVLTEKERQMLPFLFEAADIMNELFWKQAYGDKDELMKRLNSDADKAFAIINYGPWERLNNNEPFATGFGAKPRGSGFYPADITVDEFEKFDDKTKTGLYTLIKRKSDGSLESVPYHVAFKKEIDKVASLICKAAELAEDVGLKKYLELRAKALLTDDYYDSDIAWMEMKSNTIDFVVGPIENYEDQLFGYKTSYEAYILIKDKEWSKRLERYSALLPQLQKSLPCPAKYKNETPGSGSDMNAYDAIYYAGDCNAGSKTIAINLPNDEKVREAKGSRKLQLKNSMLAKFEKILVPISDVLIETEQRKHVKFDAFFENVMFHEVAHGLGLGNTIDGKITVRESLKDAYTSIEESKADILGLWAVTKLNEMGEFKDKDLMDNFVTFMTGIFRSVRFGAASAHGKANMIRFYYFQELGAFERDNNTGLYKVDFEKMKDAMLKLSEEILIIQGDGDYEKASALIKSKGVIREELQKDLERIGSAGIPRDIVFEQGKAAVGL